MEKQCYFYVKADYHCLPSSLHHHQEAGVHTEMNTIINELDMFSIEMHIRWNRHSRLVDTLLWLIVKHTKKK